MDDQSRAWYTYCEQMTSDMSRLIEKYGPLHGHNMSALGLLEFASQAAWGLIRGDDEYAAMKLSELRSYAERLERGLASDGAETTP